MFSQEYFLEIFVGLPAKKIINLNQAHRRVLDAVGDIPPAKLEQAYYDERETQAMVA